MGVCLINLMRHLKSIMELCQKTSQNQKKHYQNHSKPFLPKKSVHPEQFILSKCRKFEARIHCKVRLRPKKLQTSHCQCPHRRGCHYLDKTWQNMTKPRRYQGVTCIRFTLKRKSSSHTQCSAGRGPAELPLAAPKRPPSQASVKCIQMRQAWDDCASPF